MFYECYNDFSIRLVPKLDAIDSRMANFFSLRSVFDGIPRIVQQLAITIMLTIGGALLAWFWRFFFAIVKINRVKFYIPCRPSLLVS